MSLKKQTGNMYSFVSHTWNPIKGKCQHDCGYCYMKRFNLKDVRIDEKEFKTDLGKDNFIFVGSGTDIFAENIPDAWIWRVMTYCTLYDDNKYLFQSKNPHRFLLFDFPENTILGTTIETNRYYPEIMGECPTPDQRAFHLSNLKRYNNHKTMITIEPILDFDHEIFLNMLQDIRPDWINIGSDSKGHGLPEPSKDKIEALIEDLKKFTDVKVKSNLKRLMK